MKAANLIKLKENHINVPNFIVLENIEGEEFPTIDLSFSQGKRFAVRSSYGGEDSEAYSYAGQFDTYLNVEKEQVPIVVKQVLNSRKQASVKNYEQVHTLKDRAPMRVIVQEMVEADYSGVVFTANPLGLLNEMVTVVGKGLGNQVVEDRIDTATYYYHKEDAIYYCQQEEAVPGFDKEIFLQLMEICLTIEKLYEKKMDIEFAIQGKDIYILQARPITTLEEGGEQIVLDNSNIVESYPGVSLPLTISFVREVYYKVFQSCLFRLTGDKRAVADMDHILRNMVDVANGRIYYRISNWYDVILFLPFSGKIIPIWQEMLGVDNKKVTSSVNGKIGWRIKGKVTVSFFRLLFTCPKKMAWLNQYFEERLPLYQNRIKQAASGPELLGIYGELMADLSEKWDITLVNDMYTFLYTALAKKGNAVQLEQVRRLESMEPVKALKEILIAGKTHGLESRECRDLEEAYIEKFGDRCLEELKLETCTYRTDPQLFHAYVCRQYQEGDTQQNIEQNAKQERESVSSGQRQSFALKRAAWGIRNREISRMNRSRIFGMAREIMLKLGEMLAGKGQIAYCRDIFYLYGEEVREAVETGTVLLSKVAERKEEFALYRELPAYSRLVFQGQIFHKRLENVHTYSSQKRSSLLRGTPCSQGKIRAQALVVEEVTDGVDSTGKILVTRMTDPGWVLLIHKAAGIISEKGSLLSHTAIITRELKKPAVVGVKGAMELIHTGDMIEMDGSTGEINLCEDVREEYE